MLEFAIIKAGTPRQNSQRVLRGGSWINHARNLRSANRNANSPDNRNHNIGLRLAGALLNHFYRKAVITGGSINQWYFLFAGNNSYLYQNQDSQRVSRLLYLGGFMCSEGNAGALQASFPRGAWERQGWNTLVLEVESLLLGRLYFSIRCCYAY